MNSGRQVGERRARVGDAKPGDGTARLGLGGHRDGATREGLIHVRVAIVRGAPHRDEERAWRHAPRIVGDVEHVDVFGSVEARLGHGGSESPEHHDPSGARGSAARASMLAWGSSTKTASWPARTSAPGAGE